LDDESTVDEIRARTDLDHQEVVNVLQGNRHATVEGLYRIASMLNVPAADLINPTKTVIQFYSVDGGRSTAISLGQEHGALAEMLADKQLMYAEGLDGSYAHLPVSAMVLFVNQFEVPLLNSLYLCESDLVRCVRRCVAVDTKNRVATMSNDAHDHNTLALDTVKFAKLKAVSSETLMILGRVVFSVVPH
jgi:hypothetical protein